MHAERAWIARIRFRASPPRETPAGGTKRSVREHSTPRGCGCGLPANHHHMDAAFSAVAQQPVEKTQPADAHERDVSHVENHGV